MTSDSFSTQSFDGSEVELLELYLAGKLTGNAAQRVERWMAAHADGRTVVEGFRGGVVEVSVEPPDARDVVERVRARIDERGGWRLGRQPLRRGLWSVSLAVLTVVGLLFVGTRGLVFHLRLHPMITTYATMSGERADITLPDGSHVALDVASRLDVPTDFARGNRTLRLVGEALFTVTHHDGTPFTVISGPTTTRVLGTTFLVRRYPTDTTTTVAVRDGKVAVRSVVLTAQQQLRVDRMGNARMSASTDEFAFAAGVLALDYESLAAAIPELDRWYDADIRLGDPSLANLGVRGRFVAGSRADLASVLGLMFDVHVVRDGRIITLYPRQ